VPTRPTKRQHDLLDYIERFIGEHGYGPSYREIMRALDYKSVSTVAIHVDGLIQRGHLSKQGRSARSLTVTSPADVTADEAQPATLDPAEWLIAQVDAALVKYEAKPTERTKDDLYVLVGALHILEIKDAARYKKQLAELP
jgi:SOS-response transcriptional repressor LexA